MPGGQLHRPPAGAGRLIARLSGMGFPIIPVGTWEQNGALHLRFGPPSSPDAPATLSADEKDRFVADAVMAAIAAQLPQPLRGEFA